MFCCLQVHNHCPCVRAEAISGAHLHLVFQCPTSLLQVQDPFQDRVQDSGKISMSKCVGAIYIYLCHLNLRIWHCKYNDSEQVPSIVR